jgi:integrase
VPAAIDTKYLERRPSGTGRWYAVRDVPRELRGRLGKRLVHALNTSDLQVARSRRHAALAEFERRIEAARGNFDAEAVGYRETIQRLDIGDGAAISITESGREVLDLRKKTRFVRDLIDERALDIAGIADWEDEWRGDPQRLAAARRFAGIANGTGTPLLSHLETWLTQGNRRRPPSAATVQSYRTDVKLVTDLLTAHGVATVEGVTRALAGRVVNAMAARGDHPGTIHKRVAAMSSYWKWLQRRGIADDTVRNPWHEQGVSTTAQPNKRSFTDGELLTLLNGTDDPEKGDAMRILALSGMRVHELYNLRVADCAEGWFQIRASKTQAGVRRVPIHSDLAAIVSRRRDGKKADAFLIEEAGGTCVRRSGAFVKDFARYRVSLGVHETTEGPQSAVTLHTFRSWFASAIRAEHDQSVAAALLGHAQRGLTDRVYTKFPDDRLKAAVETVRLPAPEGWVDVRRGLHQFCDHI